MTGIPYVAYASICCRGWKGWRGPWGNKAFSCERLLGQLGIGNFIFGGLLWKLQTKKPFSSTQPSQIVSNRFFVLSKLICRKWSLLTAATGNARAKCLGSAGRQVGTGHCPGLGLSSSIHPCPDPFPGRYCNGPFRCVRKTLLRCWIHGHVFRTVWKS